MIHETGIATELIHVVDNFRREITDLFTVSGMSSPIVVDYDHLTQVATRLRASADRFDMQGRREFANLIGEPFLAAALSQVQDDWSNKRDQLVAYLRQVAQVTSEAASNYREADQMLSAVGQHCPK